MSVIYRAEDGQSYTRRQFFAEVLEALAPTIRKEGVRLPKSKLIKAAEVACQMVLSTISWEHPATVVYQFDDEDIKHILDEIAR